jgi:hypothetical protein
MIGDGLLEHRIDPLLAAEQELGLALQALATLEHPHASADLTPTLREELRQCRTALNRCLRLGATLQQFARLTLEHTGRAGAYTRDGGAPVVAPAGLLQARV